MWGWFVELSAARRQTGFGAAPLAWADIAAYFGLRGFRPARWQLAAISSLDSTFLTTIAAHQKARASKGADRGV